MRRRPVTTLPVVRFDHTVQRLLDTATVDGEPLWLVLGNDPPSPHPVLDKALRLIVERDHGIVSDHVLLVRGDPANGRRRLRLRAHDAATATLAVLLAIRDHTGRTPNLSCTWTRQPFIRRRSIIDPDRIRRMARQTELDPHRRPGVHTW